LQAGRSTEPRLAFPATPQIKIPRCANSELLVFPKSPHKTCEGGVDREGGRVPAKGGNPSGKPRGRPTFERRKRWPAPILLPFQIRGISGSRAINRAGNQKTNWQRHSANINMVDQTVAIREKSSKERGNYIRATIRWKKIRNKKPAISLR